MFIQESNTFTNEQVQLPYLPSITTLEYSKLQPAYRNVNLIWTAIIFAILMIVVLVFRVFGNSFFADFGVYLWGAITVLFALIGMHVYFGFKKKSYALRQHDLIYNEGLFWQSSTVIPFNRVQHCEISQGPIERLFDISELKIYTAGGSSSDMSIPGLLPDTAQRLKEFIILKTGHDEEE